MHEPSFWWREAGIAARLLQPLALIYGGIAGARLRQLGKAAGVPVICIGNFALGGTGKTPAAIAAARLLTQMGERPFLLSRGYGGKNAGPVQVDPDVHRAEDVGDEPLLLARAAPTIVARDRVHGAEVARQGGASVIIMDDGLQNPALEKDLTIAVVDGRRGIGNGRTFPAGPLRAPLAAQLARSDAILIVGEDSGATAPLLDSAQERGLAILHAALHPDPAAVSALAGSRLLAFAGIGQPEKFFHTLADAGLHLAATQSFDDHYRYRRADAKRLLARCDRDGLLPVTTEKDFMRLVTLPQCAALCRRTRALPVTLVFEDETRLRALLERKLRRG